MKFAPVLNSSSGLTLTPVQWQNTGTKDYAFDVMTLLQRPGLVAFELKSPGRSIVDCRSLNFNAKKQVRYQTTDGSYQTVEINDFLNWLYAMGPDAVIWPFENISMALPQVTNIIVSDKQASDACKGIFYHEKGFDNILDMHFEKDLNLLSHDCRCETCQQGFTRAYLHHLLQHTPLLAQRWLVIHNVFFTQLHGIRAE